MNTDQSHASAVFCWETLDPGIQLWWHWSPNEAMCATITQKLLRVSPMKCDKERKASNWSQNAPDPSLHGMCPKDYAPKSTVGMTWLCLKQCLGVFYRSKSIHMKTRAQGFQLEHCSVATVDVIHSGSGINAGADQCVFDFSALTEQWRDTISVQSEFSEWIALLNISFAADLLLNAGGWCTDRSLLTQFVPCTMGELKVERHVCSKDLISPKLGLLSPESHHKCQRGCIHSSLLNCGSSMYCSFFFFFW